MTDHATRDDPAGSSCPSHPRRPTLAIPAVLAVGVAALAWVVAGPAAAARR